MEFNSNINQIFKSAFESNCLLLVFEAYQLVLDEKVIQQDWHENDISQELYEKIDVNPQRLKWYISVTREFFTSQEVPKTKGFADKLPRIDLRMTRIFGELEYKFFCEAKRLKEKSSHLKRDYIKEGIDRYVTKKYPLGCMIAYLLEGQCEKAIEGVNKLLEKDERESEVLKFTTHSFFRNYCESSHPLIDILQHIILDFTSLSDDASSAI